MLHEYLEFKRWEDVPSNFKTKKQLRKLHLIPESDFEDGILDNEEYNCLELFDMIKAVYFIPKEMHIIPAIVLPLTEDYLMLALKTVRESKEKRKFATEEYPYKERFHKNEILMLDDLESKVLEKLKHDGIEIMIPEISEKIRVKDAVATLKAYLTSVE